MREPFAMLSYLSLEDCVNVGLSAVGRGPWAVGFGLWGTRPRAQAQLPAPYSYRLNNSVAFVPPNPKELDSAYWIDISRLVWGT